MSLRAKARELGVPFSTYLYRIHHGWTEENVMIRRSVLQKGYKCCSVCKIVKAEFFFYKRNGRNGYISRCKTCAKKSPPKQG